MPLNTAKYVDSRDGNRDQNTGHHKTDENFQGSQSHFDHVNKDGQAVGRNYSIGLVGNKKADLSSFKIPVPKTILSHHDNHTSDERTNPDDNNQHGGSQSQPHRMTFDDTQSISDTDEDSSFGIEQDDRESNKAKPVTEQQNLLSHDGHTYIKPETITRPNMYANVVFQTAEGRDVFLPEDWPARVEEEKRIQGLPISHTGKKLDNAINMHYHDEDSDEYRDTAFKNEPENWAYTHSRGRSASPNAIVARSVQTLSHRPAMEVRQPKEHIETSQDAFLAQDRYDNHRSKSIEGSNRFQNQKHKQTGFVTANVPQEHDIRIPSKVSSYQESSSEEDPASLEETKPNKRPLSDLDYDLEKLKTMQYSQLNETAFLIDPRNSIPPPAVDNLGNPIPLTQKLNNLSNLQVETQKDLFMSLTDVENEQVPTYFLDQLKELMQKQTQIKLDRRKIAMKYEFEIAKRQRLIEIQSNGVAEQLQGLKKGGNQLLERSINRHPANLSEKS